MKWPLKVIYGDHTLILSIRTISVCLGSRHWELRAQSITEICHFVTDSMVLSLFAFEQTQHRVKIVNWGCYGGSGSFKVIRTGTSRKPLCDFMLVVNSNPSRIFYHFQDLWYKLILPSVIEKPHSVRQIRFLVAAVWHLKMKMFRGLSGGENCIVMFSFFSTLLAQRPKNADFTCLMTIHEVTLWIYTRSVHCWNLCILPLTAWVCLRNKLGKSSKRYGGVLPLFRVLQAIKIDASR